ncbi:MAG: SRPBCC domain-containing protein [Planctomycetes bacterium]|nr:SRPBCC domain-containing protein [Planctomycetota bacterium]
MTKATLHVTTPSGRELVLTRTICASPERVFAALTRPDQIPRWLTSKDIALITCEVDLRPGGAFRYVFQTAGGRRLDVRGRYRAVEANRRVEYLETYDFSPLEVLVTTTLEAAGASTILQQTLRYATSAERDADQAGVVSSAEDAYAELERYLAQPDGGGVAADPRRNAEATDTEHQAQPRPTRAIVPPATDPAVTHPKRTTMSKSSAAKSTAKASNGGDEIAAYSKTQSSAAAAICDALRALIDQALPAATAKVWHGSPVWFDGENPVVGYSVMKKGVSLLFWNGQAFDETALEPVGKYRAAQAVFGDAAEIDPKLVSRWLKKAKADVFDSKGFFAEQRKRKA